MTVEAGIDIQIIFAAKLLDGGVEAALDQIARGLAGEIGLPGIEHRGLRQIPAHLQLPLERSLDEGVK